jgi:hypothetical protein
MADRIDLIFPDTQKFLINQALYWFDFADTTTLVTSNGNVHGVKNKAQAFVPGVAMANTLGSAYMTVGSLNDNPCVVGHASNRFHLSSAVGPVDALTAFAVVAGVDDADESVWGLSTSTTHRIRMEVDSLHTTSHSGNFTDHPESPDLTDGLPYLVVVQWNTVGLYDDFRLKVNDGDFDIFEADTTTGESTAPSIMAVMGSNAGGATNFEGKLGELIVSAGFLPTQVLNNIGRYLSTKWNIDWSDIA